MEKTIRTFIAIELCPSVKQHLANVQNKMRELLKPLGSPGRTASISSEPCNKDTDFNIKWVKPENIHLTLKFLGNTPVDNIPTITAVLEKIANASPIFPIGIKNLGAFPNVRSPKIIWIGVEEGADKLTAIVQSIEKNLAVSTTQTTKQDLIASNFTAHITLGRVRRPQAQNTLTKALSTLNLMHSTCQDVKALTLYKSQLTPQGPIYSIIATIPLISKEIS